MHCIYWFLTKQRLMFMVSYVFFYITYRQRNIRTIRRYLSRIERRNETKIKPHASPTRDRQHQRMPTPTPKLITTFEPKLGHPEVGHTPARDFRTSWSDQDESCPFPFQGQVPLVEQKKNIGGYHDRTRPTNKHPSNQTLPHQTFSSNKPLSCLFSDLESKGIGFSMLFVF